MRESRGYYAEEADSVRGICGAHGRHRTAKMRDVRRTGEGCGLREGLGKRVDEVSTGRSQSFRYQRPPVNGGRLQPMTRGDGTRRRNKGRNVSRRNRSLQRIAQSKKSARAGSLAIVD